jgi:hypothetical protein
MNPKMSWIDFVNEYAKKHGITLAEALSSPKAKLEYLNYAAVRVIK